MLVGDKIKPVSVKALVEFAAKIGSLDRKFTPGPSALEGIEGHQRVASQRSDTYQTEISLSIEYKDLLIRGRADGYQPEAHCIEEIKTFHGDFDKLPENYRTLHWAQAKFYGWMYCTLEACEHINIALVYFHLGDQKEHRLQASFSAQELQDYCKQLAERYYCWQRGINERLHQLLPWVEKLRFPYKSLHASQRQMAEAVYKAAATGRSLLAEAPTGTGKTLASIFPAIKAFNKTPVDKIFYLTAKTTGKHLALENLQLIASDANRSPIRILELTAQEKICLAPDRQCAGESCVFAQSFYDKLIAAREVAYTIPFLDKQALTSLAHQFQICPFYLGMEMSRWVDIVVADFNYYFDGNPLLLGLTREFEWHPYILVDESHNLLDRGRQMFSASLDRGLLRAAKQQAPKSLKKSLERINRYWLELLKQYNWDSEGLHLLPAPPEKISLALMEFTNEYIALMQKQPDHPVQQTQVQDFFFEALDYQLKADMVGEDYCVDMENPGSKQEVLNLRNLNPARLLAERIAFTQAACFFSATLKPAYFYRTLLGLPEDTVCMQVPSPFTPNQLTVNIAPISTRYRDRQQAIKPICTIIHNQLQNTPGNALVFFSSYEFLRQVEDQLIQELNNLDVTILTQSKQMSEEDRQHFIAAFNTQKNILGLAVLGGAFSEGVDLPGDALKGVFIATLGLPQINPVNEHMRQYLQTEFQQGYNFTYLFPGLQKVIQAAGRVIRTKKDHGYLWLMDDRFMQPEIQQLLPEWWGL